MSEELNEQNSVTENNTVTEQQNMNPEPSEEKGIQEQQNNTEPSEEKGAAQEQQSVTYRKIGQEYHPKRTTYKEDACKALGLEVSQASQLLKEKLEARQTLFERHNEQMKILNDEIKTLQDEINSKSKIAVTRESWEDVLCDVYETDKETIYIRNGESFESGEVIFKTEKKAEKSSE